MEKLLNPVDPVTYAATVRLSDGVGTFTAQGTLRHSDLTAKLVPVFDPDSSPLVPKLLNFELRQSGEGTLDATKSFAVSAGFSGVSPGSNITAVDVLGDHVVPVRPLNDLDRP